MPYWYEPRHEIANNVICATSKVSDQPAHTRSLIKAFACRLNILWLLSYWSNTIGVSKLNRRLHRLVWVNTCQYATLLEITCHGSCESSIFQVNREVAKNGIQIPAPQIMLTKTWFLNPVWPWLQTLIKGHNSNLSRGYKTFSMLNSTEQEIYPAHKC